MAVHVGLYPYAGKISCYNEASKTIEDIKIYKAIPNEPHKIPSVFEEIISKINGKPGCICIFLDGDYENQMRKKFLEEGLKCGFENVEIMYDHKTAKDFNAFSYMNYIFEDDDIIWVEEKGNFKVWEIKNQKAQCIDEWTARDLNNLERIMRERNLFEPDVVIHQEGINQEYFRKISEDCQFFVYNEQDFENRGSLMKARNTAGDPIVAYLDPPKVFLLQKYTVQFNGMKMVSFEKGHPLPITYSTKFTKCSRRDELSVTFTNGEIEKFRLWDSDVVNLMIYIDTNNVYSTTLE